MSSAAGIGVLGRERERTLLAGLLDAARTGRSSALVLRGDAGIGKSALLDYAIGLANGFRLLRARGVESESELAFSGLQELLRPVVGLLESLPSRQRAVLEGALALGPPVPGDPLAVRVATLGVIGAAAEEGPLLLVIDDAHWLDPASAEALAFAARRLQMEGVVALFAMRVAEPSAFDLTGLQELTVTGIGDQPARALLEQRRGSEMAPEVTEQLVRLAGGNPLALLEFSRGLTRGQLSGSEPLERPLQVETGIERVFARRLDQLPPPTSEALLLAAAGELDDSAAFAVALAALGLAASDFDPAERAGLITISDGRVRFRHPLVRSVIYHRAPNERRRAVHTELAAGSEDALDRRAWHLAAAAAGPDEEVAAALEEAAERAEARRGLQTAGRAYQRAAALTPKLEARARRLLAAATCAVLSGGIQWASDLIADGSALSISGAMLADFRHLAGVVERLLGSALRSHEMFWDAASAVAGEDPARATLLMIEAITTDIMLGDLDAAAASGRQARELARDCFPALKQVAAYAADIAAAYRGEIAPEELGTEVARAAAKSLELSPVAAVGIDLCLTRGLVIEGQTDSGDRLERAIKEARDVGSLGKLPFLLGQGAQVDYRAGRWTRARARATEAAELAGPTSYRAWGLVHLARVAAAEGQEQECRALVEEAWALARARGHRSLEVHLLSVLGLLELGLGSIPAAVEQLTQCAREAAAEGLGNPVTVPYEPDLVEALHAAGRAEEARAAADLLQHRSERVRSAWGLAAAARCRGLLANEADVDAEFRAALALHAAVPGDFERARTQLCYGERLRRLRRRRAALEQLSAALATFEQFRAVSWAGRAREELRAAGFLTNAQRRSRGADRLTPQELRVALIVAEGASIREAGAQLFLSPKTIEAHLGRVYQKLGVHNRAQLATAIAREQTGA